MEVDEKFGGIQIPVDPILLPSLFRAKVDNPTYKTWKAVSESKDESWEEIQVSFLHVSEEYYNPRTGDSIGKYLNSNQISEEATLLEKQQNFINKAVKEGTGVPDWIYKKLSEDERKQLKKLMQEKKQQDGG